MRTDTRPTQRQHRHSVSGRPARACPAPPDVVPGSARPLAAPLGRPFWRLWAAATASSIGDGFALVAFPLLAARETNRPALVAGVIVAQRLPQLLLGLIAGALADRLHRGRLMVACDLLRAGILVAILGAGVTGNLALPILYTAAFAMACVETLFAAAAHASLPLLVDDAGLDRGNGYLFASQLAGEQVVGQAMAGVLFAVAAMLPIGLDAASFVVSSLLLATLVRRLPAPASSGNTRVLSDVADGLRFFRDHRLLRALTTLVAAYAFFQAMTISVLVLFALQVLHLGEAGYGAFLAVAAIGNIAGALVAPRLRARLAPTPVLLGAGVVAAVAYVGVGLARSVVVATVLLACEAIAVACGNVVSISMRQSVVPDHLRGRVGHAMRTCVWSAMPAGAIAGGWLGTVAGVRAPFVVAGVAQLLVVVVVGRRLRSGGADVHARPRVPEVALAA